MASVTPQEIGDLQSVSDYRLVRSSLRWPAIGSIFFGLIAIVMGYTSIGENPINALLAIIGGLLLIEGIWLIAAPSPKGMIVDGAVLIVLGLWNIGISIMNLGATGELPIFIMVGGYQIVWGCQSFGRYRRFAAVSSQKPSQESIKRVDEIIKSVNKMKPNDSTDIIQFQTAGGWSGRSWKGRLAEDCAIFVCQAGDEVLFIPRGEAQFTAKDKKARPGKALKVSIRLGKSNYYGTIPPESMQRYESWKATPA